MRSTIVETLNTRSLSLRIDFEKTQTVADRLFSFAINVGLPDDVKTPKRAAWAGFIGLCYLRDAQMLRGTGDSSKFEAAAKDCSRWYGVGEVSKEAGKNLNVSTFAETKDAFGNGQPFPDIRRVYKNAGATFCGGETPDKKIAYACLRLGIKHHNDVDDTSLKWIIEGKMPLFSKS